MTTTWTRAWLATLVLLIAAGAIVSSRHDTLLVVEEPVMEWLLDDADTSGWDRVQFLLSPLLLWAVTIALVILGGVLNRWVGAAALLSVLLGFIVSAVVRGVVERPSPVSESVTGFPHTGLVHSAVVLGLVVLFAWWLRAPKLLWHIVLEIVIFATLLSSVRLMVRGDLWPSDVVGAALVAVLSLIPIAAVMEAFPRPAASTQEVEVVSSIRTR